MGSGWCAPSFPTSTNHIENVMGNARGTIGRVCRWHDDTNQVARWMAVALLRAQSGFRRVRGHEQLAELAAALELNQRRLVHVQQQGFHVAHPRHHRRPHRHLAARPPPNQSRACGEQRCPCRHFLRRSGTLHGEPQP
jgi:hypothetical protein